MIPSVELAGGTARIIAGELNLTKGPARTFTPVNLWDLRLQSDSHLELPLPEGHNSLVAVLSGHITTDGQDLGPAEIASFSVDGEGARIEAQDEAMVLLLTGEPIDEPVVGYGPFVMNSEAEIRKAIEDYNAGRFGTAV